MLFVMVLPAQAFTGMTADELRSEIARLTNVADAIRAQLRQLGDIPNPSSFCMQSNLQMKRGHSGSSVSRLQQFLVQSGVYPADLVTGYFGPATEAGVQRWQATNGVVSYGTPNSTGFGRVGPSTLRAMHRGCPGGSYIGPSGTLTNSSTQPSASNVDNIIVEKYSLSLNPTRGTAPLRVTADFTINGSTCTSYLLDWGDGSSPVSYNSSKSTDCKPKTIKVSKAHLYRSVGTSSVIFKTGKAPISKIKKVNELRVDAIGYGR